MKLALCLSLVVACAHATPTPATPINIAEDTVHYIEPGAKCERGFARDDLQSVRCVVAGGAFVYCTASSAGFVCQPLNQQASPPEPKKPEAPPASPSTPAPTAAAPTPPAKPEAPKKK